MIYPGHPAGAQEAVVLDKFAAQLDPDRFTVVRYAFAHPHHRERPYLLAIEKS